MPPFIPGLKLSERFYREIVAPILRNRFPRMKYSAGLVGPGSEVLGLDDSESADHHWGLRLRLFVSPRDQRHRREISRALAAELPVSFLGFSTNFSPADLNDNGVRLPAPIALGPVNHMIEIETPATFFRRVLGVDPSRAISGQKWLGFSEQSLLEATAGRIFHDGLRVMNPLRRKLGFYPRRIWLERMAREWHEIGEEEPFVGRTGFRGDDIGSRLIAARLVGHLMQLCFLIERRYAPYSKWFGTAFRQLRCAAKLSPILTKTLSARDWKTREKHLCAAYQAVARMHNALGITRPVPVKISSFFGRQYRVIWGESFAVELRRAAAKLAR